MLILTQDTILEGLQFLAQILKEFQDGHTNILVADINQNSFTQNPIDLAEIEGLGEKQIGFNMGIELLQNLKVKSGDYSKRLVSIAIQILSNIIGNKTNINKKIDAVNDFKSKMLKILNKNTAIIEKDKLLDLLNADSFYPEVLRTCLHCTDQYIYGTIMLKDGINVASEPTLLLDANIYSSYMTNENEEIEYPYVILLDQIEQDTLLIPALDAAIKEMQHQEEQFPIYIVGYKCSENVKEMLLTNCIKGIYNICYLDISHLYYYKEAFRFLALLTGAIVLDDNAEGNLAVLGRIDRIIKQENKYLFIKEKITEELKTELSLDLNSCAILLDKEDVINPKELENMINYFQGITHIELGPQLSQEDIESFQKHICLCNNFLANHKITRNIKKQNKKGLIQDSLNILIPDHSEAFISQSLFIGLDIICDFVINILKTKTILYEPLKEKKT